MKIYATVTYAHVDLLLNQLLLLSRVVASPGASSRPNSS